MKNKLITFAFIVCYCIQLEAQDFRVEDFRENLTDLSAAMAGVKDRNNKDAALLRFSVRDNKFEIESNLGVLKQEQVTGEIHVYVPEDTKRITIRHPLLGVLRDFTLPLPIKSRFTYDAEIVITKKEYLQALFGNANVDVFSDMDANSSDNLLTDSQNVNSIKEESFDEDSIGTVTIEEEVIEKENLLDNSVEEEPIVVDSLQEDSLLIIEPLLSHKTDTIKFKFSDLDFFVGIGINAISVTGPSIHLGIAYKAIAFEAGYVYGFGKVNDVAFTQKGATGPAEVYDYSCSKLWLRLGFSHSHGKKFKVSPQAGVSFNMINGKVTGGMNNTSYYKKSSPMSVLLALRLSYEVTNKLFVHITPQYDFALSNDEVYGVLKNVDNKIKAWGEGFGVNVGLLYNF